TVHKGQWRGGGRRLRTLGRRPGLACRTGRQSGRRDNRHGGRPSTVDSGSVMTLEVHLDDEQFARDLREDVRAGLTATPKWLPPKWFYDARGSELFEEITRLPEYYPTRAEREILVGRAPAIAAATGARTLVELGSGSSEKTRLLLDALRDAGTLDRYVPVDVSESALVAAAQALRAEYPSLAVHGV